MDEAARTHPGAAASLEEGMEETLTVTRLGVRGRLKRTPASTNPCESMIETVRRVADSPTPSPYTTIATAAPEVAASPA